MVVQISRFFVISGRDIFDSVLMIFFLNAMLPSLLFIEISILVLKSFTSLNEEFVNMATLRFTGRATARYKSLFIVRIPKLNFLLQFAR